MTATIEVRPADGVPETGQLVSVRDRRWVVTNVERSTQPLDVLGAEPGRHEHLVTMASVEDDGFGEELRVVWELELATSVLERAALPVPDPDRFDEPARLDAFLDAVRWGAITSADTRALQAPFRSGITIEDYQLDPVVRALSMPRANLLIADDVGLGKTIEAGLVVQELLLRHRARTVLVVCPASLCVKWRDELAEKFGLEFRIVDAELRRSRGPYVNPWTHFPHLIASVDWLKRDRPMRLLRDVLPAGPPTLPRTFDLLIVDEVHGCAPSGRGRYATDSLRTAAIRAIAPHFEHRLFLSATPHNGYPGSFEALLELLAGRSAAWMGSSSVSTRSRGNQYDQQAKGVTANVTFWPRPVTVVMNRKAFESLTPSQQDALQQAGASVVARQEKFMHYLNSREAAHILCQRGLRFLHASNQDLAGLRRGVQPVYDQLERDAQTRSLLQQIQAMKHEARATAIPDAPACSPSASATSPANQQATPLDGIYRTSFTRKELANSPSLMDGGEINDENWGEFTLTFERGRVTFAQRNDVVSTSTSGAYTISGKAIVLRFTEGGNAGETFTANWSLYRDVLTLKRGSVPTPYVVKPWRRAG